MTQLQEFFAPHAALSSRLSIWNKRLGEALLRLRGCTLQKISATDDGYLVLSVYKPGDDRSSVLLSIRRGEAGVVLSHAKPPAQSRPNSVVQVARKHLQGRSIAAAYASLDPVAVVLEFHPPRENPGEPPSEKEVKSDRRKAKQEADTADCLILDLDSRPARLCIARKLKGVPERYVQIAPAFQGTAGEVFESLNEWTLEGTKTKRRPTFDVPLLTYCVLPSALGTPQVPVEKSVEKSAEKSVERPLEKTFLPKVAAPATNSLQAALASFPTHVRRAAKTRLQFLERRLLRQRQDLPSEAEIRLLEKRAEGLRANLYMWPKDTPTWYVPRDLIEELGLPALFTLKHGEKPGDLLSRAFTDIDRLKRRQSELSMRTAESAKSHENFISLILAAATEIATIRAELSGTNVVLDVDLDGNFDSNSDRKTGAAHVAEAARRAKGAGRGAIEAGVAKKLPQAAGRLLAQLELEWTEGGQAVRDVEAEKARRLPYRAYEASTGEFIRVAKSAADGDAMLRLMPAHHTWVHVMTGEGSHVWLEKPKKAKPSTGAVREASILAIHHSKQSRAMEAEVYVATRADIDKKKDLAPGKVIVRKAGSLLVRYEDAELQKVLATHGQAGA